MSKTMRFSSTSRLALAAGVMLAGLAASGLTMTAEATPRSLPVRGSFTSRGVAEGCTSPVGLCEVDLFRGTLNGQAEGVVSSLMATPGPGIAEADAMIVIHDRHGDLSCRAQAVINTSAGSDSEFAFVCEVTGGTGRYEGASGYIQSYGSIPPGATDWEATYGGKVMLPS